MKLTTPKQIGLAICKGLCKAMGGNIWYDSIPGERTTFTCNLCLPQSNPTSDSEDIRKGSGKSQDRETLPSLKGLNVLLAEDNSTNQRVGVRILGTLGASVKVLEDQNAFSRSYLTSSRPQVANNGQECLNMMRDNPFDIVLMDLEMPVMDGFEATRQIRSQEASAQIKQPTQHSRSGIPVIALTASSSADIQQRCQESGMDGYLGKPFKKEELAKVIRTHAGRTVSSSP